MPGLPVSVNTHDARGLTFACQSGCGFCCTATPLVLPHEAGGLGSMVVRAEDGTLRIPIQGVACGALRTDKSCGVYANRPGVCHLYPFQVHAGRRVQVTLTLACPGVAGGAHAPPRDAARRDAAESQAGGDDAAIEAGAEEAARRALEQPGARESAQRARETFAEYDRRMREWGVDETPDRLRSAFLPHLSALARPERLPTFFTGVAEGDLVLRPKPAKALDPVFAAEPDTTLPDLLQEAARDAFSDPDGVLWVEEGDYAWTSPRLENDAVRLVREKDGVARPAIHVEPAQVPTAWTPEASDVLERYLHRLLHRDQTEGSAAWLVDATGYQVTPAAAFARVLGEAALQVVLRAGLLAAEQGATTVDAKLAWRGVAAYETSYHSLPTLGSIL